MGNETLIERLSGYSKDGAAGSIATAHIRKGT